MEAFPEKERLLKHIDNFKNRSPKNNRRTGYKDYRKKLSTSIGKFKNRNNMSIEKDYSLEEVVEHLNGYNAKCYLTGDSIDMKKDLYCLDHIIPVSKGGNNELENMGITTPEANASKLDLKLEEYLELCKKVLINFGYKVEKI